MYSKLMPKAFFHNIFDITPQWLKDHGIKAIVTDLDDTLTVHRSAVADKRVEAWFKTMTDAGFPVCVLSNNTGDRARRFCDSRRLKYVSSAMKPLKKGFRAACRICNTQPDKTAMIGDQIFTDIWGGNRAGLYTIAVAPVGEKATTAISMKRLLEKPVWKVFFGKKENEHLVRSGRK